MSLIVQKFGGTSVADFDRLQNVAKIVVETKKAGNDVVVVVSAQGDTTDLLEKKAAQINSNPSKREMDVLLSTGEQISMALLAMAIEKLGFPCISLTGWQAGFRTNTNHCCARIEKIASSRLEQELALNKIIIVAGFQGIDKFNNITTLGRGGSDTSAVALAAALHADLCQIYTDVDGIYTADPHLVDNAFKLNEISFDEMLELASLGARVLHNRSIEMAKRYNIKLEVLSSFKKHKGTQLKEKINMERMLIRGVTRDDDTARVDLIGVPLDIDFLHRVFSLLGNNNINIDLMGQAKVLSGRNIVSFTVASKQLDLAKKIMQENKAHLQIEEIRVLSSVSKVSIVGAGMQANPVVAAKFFEALASEKIEVHSIATSEIKISALVDRNKSARAVKLIHEKFFG